MVVKYIPGQGLFTSILSSLKLFRFHKLVWGTFGMEKEETPSGILVGGTDSGSVVLWNPVKILNGETEDAVLVQNDKHTGMCNEILVDLRHRMRRWRRL